MNFDQVSTTIMFAFEDKSVMTVSECTQGGCSHPVEKQRPILTVINRGVAIPWCVPDSCDLCYSLIKNNKNTKDYRLWASFKIIAVY